MTGKPLPASQTSWPTFDWPRGTPPGNRPLPSGLQVADARDLGRGQGMTSEGVGRAARHAPASHSPKLQARGDKRSPHPSMQHRRRQFRRTTPRVGAQRAIRRKRAAHRSPRSAIPHGLFGVIASFRERDPRRTSAYRDLDAHAAGTGSRARTRSDSEACHDPRASCVMFTAHRRASRPFRDISRFDVRLTRSEPRIARSPSRFFIGPSCARPEVCLSHARAAGRLVRSQRAVWHEGCAPRRRDNPRERRSPAASSTSTENS